MMQKMLERESADLRQAYHFYWSSRIYFNDLRISIESDDHPIDHEKSNGYSVS